MNSDRKILQEWCAEKKPFADSSGSVVIMAIENVLRENEAFRASIQRMKEEARSVLALHSDPAKLPDSAYDSGV